jgi:hypothetical protein
LVSYRTGKPYIEDVLKYDTEKNIWYQKRGSNHKIM